MLLSVQETSAQQTKDTHASAYINNCIYFSDNFMHGLYRMFIGDARPNSDKDDWIFQDIDSIQDIIIPASRITLKIHQVILY